MDAHDDIRKVEETRCSPVGLRVLKWIGITLVALVLLVVGLLCVGTWWLSPERLTAIVNREASERLDADVRASNVRFTLWSTFPHLRLEMDSLYVRSRTLDSIPTGLREDLDRFLGQPKGNMMHKSIGVDTEANAGAGTGANVSGNGMGTSADFLLSTAHMAGGVNLLKLISGQIWLRDVVVDSLRVNLVDVTDSINNYSIVPSTGKSKVPYFVIDGMKISGAGEVAYHSLPSRSDARVALSGASLEPRGRRDEYALRLGGKVTVASGGLNLLRNFPVELDGDVSLRFKPFGIATTDYKVNLGAVKGRMSMDMDIAGQSRLNRFACALNGFTLSDLMEWLPEDNYPVLKRLNADVELDASARLTTPYTFASVYLPSVEVDFDVPDGEVSYTLSDGERYTVNQVGLEGHLLFDGRYPAKSYVDIPEFYASGLGAEVRLKGRITDLTGEPTVRATFSGRGNLADAARQIPALKPYALKGSLGVDADVCFKLSEETLSGAILDLRAQSDDMGFTYGPYKVNVRGFHAGTDESYARALTGNALLHNVPFELEAGADAVTLDDSRDSLSVTLADVDFKGGLSREGNGAVMRRMDVALKSRAANLATSHGVKGGLERLDVRFTASRMNEPQISPAFEMPASWTADARTLGFAPHTPEFLKVTLPDALGELMRQYRTRLDVKLASAEVRIPEYPAENRLRDLDVSASFDSVVVRHVALSSGDTRGNIALRVDNLRQFLTSPTPAPLDLDLDLNLDTVQINQLARFYTAGHPTSAIARGDKVAMAEGIDTVAMLLPRNLRARIHATAMQTRYINLHLYDLMTNVSIADGRADVDTLHISSDFGAASLKYSYDTRDMQRMGMTAAVNIENINVVRFFQNFQKLLLMMPEMKNLSGDLSATLQAHMLMFPNMYLNVPSVWADAHVRGRDLQLKQNQFIHHVVRMLMIPGDTPLQIADIDIHAGVHSNLLEVFPFTFEMSKYKLTGQGLNNFNGEMYYHIGVDDWPLKLPFGINIKGHYHHPVLRFGGKDWHDDNGAEVTAGVMDYDRMNIMRETRRYMGEFVHTAASYTGE